MDKESRIQFEIFRYFNNTYCLKHHQPRYFIFSVPNESKSRQETMVKKSMGLRSGVSDLIIVLPDIVLFIEVKTDTGRQSETQKDFQKTVENLNHNYLLVRSLEDFKTKMLKFC